MPIPSIPVEIIQQILRLACVPSTDAPPDVGRVTSHFTPLKLSHVCRTWRQVAVSDPQLWTNIFFYLGSLGLRPNFKLMELYLERSRNRPLHVNLDLEEYTSGDPKKLLKYPRLAATPYVQAWKDKSYSPHDSHPLLATIFSNFHRWKTAKLFIKYKGLDSDMWSANLYSKLRDGSPLLESLEVSCQVYMDVNIDPFPPLSSLWTNCPRLTKLAVHLEDVEKSEELIEVYDDMGMVPNHSDSDSEAECIDPTVEDWVLTNEIPYHQLTHLDLDAGPGSHFTWTEVARIFGLAQNLRGCSLRGIDRFSEYEDQLLPRVVLEHLQHLYLSSDHNKTFNRDSIKINIVTCLNETLTAPSLRTLAVDNDKELWDTTAYTEFITRSDCSLSELHFNPSPANNVNTLLTTLRSSSTTLRVLHSNHQAVLGTQFTSAMSRWDDRAGEFDLCPRLEKLVVQVQDSKERTPLDRLTEMLMKRRLPPDGSHPAFKMLSIDISPKMAKVARPSLVLLRKHMKLTVGEYRKPTSEPVWYREEHL